MGVARMGINRSCRAKICFGLFTMRLAAGELDGKQHNPSCVANISEVGMHVLSGDVVCWHRIAQPVNVPVLSEARFSLVVAVLSSRSTISCCTRSN